MTVPNSRYAFWQSCLAAKEANKPIPAAVVDQPECGFWRLKRHGQWVPVAVWPLPGTRLIEPGLGFKIGTEVVGWQVGCEQWPRYCSNAITEAVYRAVERGEPWPDADPTVEAILKQPQAEAAIPLEDDAKFRARILAVAPAAARNLIDTAGPFELDAIAACCGLIREGLADAASESREQITAALAGVGAYAKIQTDDADVRALSLRNMLNDLAAAADKAREAEKAPHLTAERAVDRKWQPMIGEARDGARKIKNARDSWQDDKRAAAADANRRAQEALAQQMLEAAEKGEPAPIAAPPPKSNLPPPSTQVRPAYGKASSDKTKMVVTAVDIDKLVKALRGDPAQGKPPRPEWPTVEAYLQELAQKLANRGIILDGVTAEEKSNTR